ncbi:MULTISPECIES: PhoH family protein [unclassified Exiguobacterium]|uniref:PhoH family protein n=1 Tax=unclassified Exiguobacterium TaxID=2644629 RepID=UPI00103955A9|nr:MULTISPECIES: PhoH family protein [unclassified Exiguobacterium]TCI73790.1 PhoH family protein [Exiguobacterium sp. IPCI3]TCI82947.1 PhoH family protein [Exiguobacterium sp. IPCH1]TCI84002.1 PhoH family protein [Exiguobacterium sp. IPBC4]
MKKTYVLDTNVLLHDPLSLFQFDEHDVVIPAIVLEELDGKKRNMDEVGRNARETARVLDQLRTTGKLHDGVPLENGGRLFVEIGHEHTVDFPFDVMTNDNRILTVALGLMKQYEHDRTRKVVVVSKDILVRVKADAIGIEAEDYLTDHIVDTTNLYAGYREIEVDQAIIDEFYKVRQLPLEAVSKNQLYPNSFVVLKSNVSKASALAVVDGLQPILRPLSLDVEHVWGIHPRNVQQRMALDLLLRDDIPFVTLLGKAGTGKTLLALAAGLSLVEDERRFNKLVVARPVVPMGNDIGYLPGEMEEKLRPWMQPIYDNLEFLFNANSKEELGNILAGIKSIQLEALTYIRGRSMPDQFIIIDEAQNLTKHEIKTILTRVGENSKIVLVGDPYQIDHPYLDEYSNGLTYAVERFKGQNVFGHVQLIKGERSSLARLAADLL